MIRAPMMRILGIDSLNSIQENRIDSTYPELNIGYAILSFTRDKITNQTRVVNPYIAIPLRTYGFRNACISLLDASRRLLMRPIVFMPCLNRICPITVSKTLKNKSKKSFISLLYHAFIFFPIFNSMETNLIAVLSDLWDLWVMDFVKLRFYDKLLLKDFYLLCLF